MQDLQKIGIITYQAPHLKTEQVLNQLLLNSHGRGGGGRFVIYSLPFVYRKERVVLFEHRPKQSEAVSAQEIAQQWQIPFKMCQSDVEIDGECEIYLVVGSGILSNACLREKKILNVHPGIIPNSRGLDSFKWAILKNRPLGVSLHFIDTNVDYGEIIAVQPTPIYPSDSLQTLARRHYENEISMLVNFEHYLHHPKNHFEKITFSEPTKRMQLLEEKKMLEHFNEYKEEMCQEYNGLFCT